MPEAQDKSRKKLNRKLFLINSVGEETLNMKKAIFSTQDTTGVHQLHGRWPECFPLAILRVFSKGHTENVFHNMGHKTPELLESSLSCRNHLETFELLLSSLNCRYHLETFELLQSAILLISDAWCSLFEIECEERSWFSADLGMGIHKFWILPWVLSLRPRYYYPSALKSSFLKNKVYFNLKHVLCSAYEHPSMTTHDEHLHAQLLSYGWERGIQRRC